MAVPVVPKPVTNTNTHALNATRLPMGTRNVATATGAPISEPLPTFFTERESYGLPYNVYGQSLPKRHDQSSQSRAKLDFGSAAEFAMTFEGGGEKGGPLDAPLEGSGEFSLRALIASGVYARNSGAGVPIEGIAPPGSELNIEL